MKSVSRLEEYNIITILMIDYPVRSHTLFEAVRDFPM
jgi:hypothetical protein